MMNNELWSKILDFKMDNPTEEYGFVTRLSIENSWTSSFAQTAILEYKRFMYLAATYDEMVSPSEIVDIVWHQHLIFTVSYNDFCTLVSKKIEHIPSTHSKVDRDKFLKAKNKTKELYEINFGSQPDEFWKFGSDLDSLQLHPSPVGVKYNIPIFLISFTTICIIAYFLLKPILVNIDSSDFLLYYPLVCMLFFALLDYYIKIKFDKTLIKIQSNAIIQNLTPFEVIYLQKKHLAYVVHGVVNILLEQKKIKITEDKKLTVLDERMTGNRYSDAILRIMNEYEFIPYLLLVKIAVKMPVFDQIKKPADKIRNHIYGSRKVQFATLFSGICISLLLSIGASRLFLGISRGKPILFLLFLMVALTLFSIFYLNRITHYFFEKTIPSFYENVILTNEHKKDWQWQYFLLGSVLLAPAFTPMTNYINRRNYDYMGFGSDNGGSCGSSCGSSCGGGCGGCGGGD